MSTAHPQVEAIELRPRRRGLPHGWRTLSVYLLVIGVVIFAGIFAGVISPHDPDKQVIVERLQGPVWQTGDWNHVFGTDALGRDQFSRVIHGARISLTVVVIVIPVAVLLGTLLGLLAGWRLGLVDRGIMRVVDVQLAFPAILVAVLLAAITGPSLRNVIIILTIFLWAPFARLVRAETIALRERDYVLAAQTIGARDSRILGSHVLPNLVNSIIVLATLQLATVIIAEASLSFLGVGAEIGTPSWGSMVAEGRDLLSIKFWLVGIPGLAIVIVALVANLMGDWLRDFLDPRLRRAR